MYLRKAKKEKAPARRTVRYKVQYIYIERERERERERHEYRAISSEKNDYSSIVIDYTIDRDSFHSFLQLSYVFAAKARYMRTRKEKKEYEEGKRKKMDRETIEN